MITHLEKLVRTLPRQRRAFAAQASRGFGTVCFGFVLASLGSLRLLSEPHTPGWSLYLTIVWTILGAYLMLVGGYRYTKADLLLHENAALIAAVNDAINEQRGEVELEIRFDGKQFKGDIERALDMALRDHRRGTR